MSDPKNFQGPQAKKNGTWQAIRRWLQPGLGIKRWMVVLVFGTTLMGLGLASLLLDVYRNYPSSETLAWISLHFLPRWLRGIFLLISGAGVMAYAIVRLNRTLLAPYMRPGSSVADVIAEHRRLGRGPKIVAVGGGTGLSTLLRGLKHHSANLTAIVTTADDGGSSGRLRRSLGLPPPGDLRNCLAALSDDEALLTQLFRYRFRTGEELDGHSFGNLFIAALSGVTGSFERGLLEAGHVLRIRGRVVPSTLSNVSLTAEKTPAYDVQAIRIEGESRIPELPGRIQRVYLEPGDAPAYPEAIHAILNADLIVLGPGSLYTSLMPNLLIPDITRAIRASRAFKIFVCNVATQPGETDDHDCIQHVRAIENHVGVGLMDLVIANDGESVDLPTGVFLVKPPSGYDSTVPIYRADLLDKDQPWRHDSERLADVLISLLEERTGPLELPPMENLEQVSGLN